MEGVRKILHVDMDAFYASVEQLDRPELRGRPVAVGGRPEGRGVVAAASYEARAFGVRSAIPMARAVALCPGLAVVAPRFRRYKEISETVFSLFREVTPLVEPLSLDEAYLDVTENAWGEPLGVEVARRLKREIVEHTGLTASAGVAPNKFLAKIASGWRKPDGLTVVAPSRVESFLRRLPVEALWGVGPRTTEKLAAIGIRRATDLRTADPEALRRAVGSFAETLVALSRGSDPRPVVVNRPRQSISSETTFPEDLRDPAELERVVEELSGEVAAAAARRELSGRTVTLKVRYADFVTCTRSDTRLPPTRSHDEISRRARALLSRTEAGRRPIRLLGVGLHGLTGEDAETPPLFTGDAEP